MSYFSARLLWCPQATDAHAAYWPSDSNEARVAVVYCSTVMGGVPQMTSTAVPAAGRFFQIR